MVKVRESTDLFATYALSIRHSRKKEGLPIIGDPDAVADELAQLADAGARGLALSFINYLDELPYFCAEVLPRLARAGLRARL